MEENQTGRYADGMKKTLDFIKKSEQIDLLNEGTVSLHVPRVCRVIRLKLGAHTPGLKGTESGWRRSRCSTAMTVLENTPERKPHCFCFESGMTESWIMCCRRDSVSRNAVDFFSIEGSPHCHAVKHVFDVLNIHVREHYLWFVTSLHIHDRVDTLHDNDCVLFLSPLRWSRGPTCCRGLHTCLSSPLQWALPKDWLGPQFVTGSSSPQSCYLAPSCSELVLAFCSLICFQELLLLLISTTTISCACLCCTCTFYKCSLLTKVGQKHEWGFKLQRLHARCDCLTFFFHFRCSPSCDGGDYITWGGGDPDPILFQLLATNIPQLYRMNYH